MHKPKRKSKYWEQFSYEYDGVTYSGKKNCCEKLGLRYLGVLQHAHDYNCTFEEAISQMLENKQKTGVPSAPALYFRESILLFLGIYLVHFVVTYIGFRRNVEEIKG